MMMEEPARHMMGGMMSSPMTQGAMMAATGFAAGRGLLEIGRASCRERV